MKLKILVAAVLAAFLSTFVVAQDKTTTTEKMKSSATAAEVQTQQQKLKELAPEFEKLLRSKGMAPANMATAGIKCETVCSAKVIIGPDGKPQTVMECSLICR